MKIEGNIIKHHLRSVLFLSGGAYGGKTTMAKLLEQKYGFIRYREGDAWDAHITYATRDHQPAMTADRARDWYGFFSQPYQQYQQWLVDGIREEAEMGIMDLVILAAEAKRRGTKVIADIMVPIDILKEVADPDQVVLLAAPVAMKRAHYFDREDKTPIMDLILSLPDSDLLLENCKNALAYRGEEELQTFRESGFMYIERNSDSTIEGTLETIEKHFGLASR